MPAVCLDLRNAQVQLRGSLRAGGSAARLEEDGGRGTMMREGPSAATHCQPVPRTMPKCAVSSITVSPIVRAEVDGAGSPSMRNETVPVCDSTCASDASFQRR